MGIIKRVGLGIYPIFLYNKSNQLMERDGKIVGKY